MGVGAGVVVVVVVGGGGGVGVGAAGRAEPPPNAAAAHRARGKAEGARRIPGAYAAGAGRARVRRLRTAGVAAARACHSRAVLSRLVLIGDIHTEATRLGHVLRHAAAAGVDAVLAVGDIVDGPEDAGACVAMLRDAGALAVRGNHERWLVDGDPLEPFTGDADALAWLAALPPTRHVDTAAGPLLLCHGVGADDMQRLRPDDEGYALASNFALEELLTDGVYRWMVGGHTHAPMIRRFGALTVLNPGTLARADDPGFLEVDLARGRGRWYRVGLDGVSAGRAVSLAIDGGPE